MSGDSAARLERSREWLAARQAALADAPAAIARRSDFDLAAREIEPPKRAVRSPAEPRQASDAREQLHSAEAKIIDAALAKRGAGNFRRGSGFRAPPRNNLDRNFVARVWFVAKMIEQKSWSCRAKGKHGGSIGAVAIEVLRTLLFVVKKIDGRLFPSLETIGRLSRKSKQAVVTAIKVLERLGFITVHRRLKRIDTPYGVRVVQDSNAYQFHLPATSLGALAMAVFCGPASGSTKSDASKHHVAEHTGSKPLEAVKRSGREEGERWWLAPPILTDNGSWR